MTEQKVYSLSKPYLTRAIPLAVLLNTQKGAGEADLFVVELLFLSPVTVIGEGISGITSQSWCGGQCQGHWLLEENNSRQTFWQNKIYYQENSLQKVKISSVSGPILCICKTEIGFFAQLRDNTRILFFGDWMQQHHELITFQSRGNSFFSEYLSHRICLLSWPVVLFAVKYLNSSTVMLSQ